MSEHDTFDLDRAFESLTNDVSGASRPPGARNAITRSRRRRTTLASVAGVAALAVAAATLQLTTSDRSAEPTTGVDDPLPAAHVFDAAALTAATDGWSGTWDDPTGNEEMSNLADPVCFNKIDASKVPNEPPKTTGDLVLTTPAHEVSFATLADFKSDVVGADATWTSFNDGFVGCSAATRSGDLAWSGAEAVAYDLAPTKAGGSPQHLWLAREGNAVGLLWVTGGPTPVPGEVDDRVMTALVAGLQSEDSFKGNGGLTVSGSASSAPSASVSSSVAVPMRTVSDGDFAQALGTWQSGWRRDSGPKVDTTTAPCLSPSDIGSSSGGGASLGGNGSYEMDTFDSVSSAAAAFQQVPGDLTACNSAPWTVRQVDRTGAGPVTVATTPAQGGLVMWMVQSGTAIGFITIGGNVSTDPPDSVSQAVGDAIAQSLSPITR